MRKSNIKQRTIYIDEKLFLEARIKAMREGTSVSKIIEKFLLEYVKGNKEETEKE